MRMVAVVRGLGEPGSGNISPTVEPDTTRHSG